MSQGKNLYKKMDIKCPYEIYRKIVKTWDSMMRRCYNKSDCSYKDYGNRGIKVCDEWHDKWNFVKWAEDKCDLNLTLDRINVDENYSPENCRWSTRKEQSRNKRCNVYITFNGEKRLLKEVCEEKGFDYKLAHARYKKFGNIEEMIFFTGNFKSKTILKEMKEKYKCK